MPKFSTKHPQREQVFNLESFHDGLNLEKNAAFISRSELSACKNLKYVSTNTGEGKKVTLKKRQGTIKISSASIGEPVTACTYYINQQKYILATATKIYYLDTSFAPVEIGDIEGVPTFTEFNSKLIIHDGQTTKYWDGTTFDKLHRSFYDELLATGDNAETEFAGTVTNPSVVPSTLEITFTDTTSKEISDDGIGRLTGNVASSWVKNISDCADNGDGLIEVTSNAHGFSNGDEINIQSVVGTTETNNSESNPTWTIQDVDTNVFTLTGSGFETAYTSGGTASKNTIIYSTGVYAFKCDGAPDDTTLVEADYEEQDGGEESSAGFVRASRLYLTGCPDHPSRLYYTAANDEKAVDTSAGGGYLDIDPNDGYELKGGLNFETSILLGKENSLHRIDDYPGDATFKVEKITDDLGFTSHRTHLFEGHIVSFMSNEGWTAMHPSQRYGDIQKGISLSQAFSSIAAKYINRFSYSTHNPIDKQLWLSLSDGAGRQLDYFFVVNLATGGQLSIYQFNFKHASFYNVNGEVLIGGMDGNLYRLDKTDTIFTDNDIDYSNDCYVRTGFLDWNLPFNQKHNNGVYVKITGGSSVSANLKIYINENYILHDTIPISILTTWGTVYSYSGTTIYSLSGSKIYSLKSNILSKAKTSYRSIMYGIENISGSLGAEILGLSSRTAVIGLIGE